MADSFVFYRSFRETINMIPNADQREQMFQALLTYGLDEVQPALEYPLDAIFNQMMESIKGAKKRYEKQTTYGKRGGAPKGNQNAKNHGAPKGNQNAKKQTKTNNLNKNVNDNVNINDNVNLHYSAVGSRLNAEPPSQKKIVRKVNEETGEVIYVYAD